MVHSRFSNPSYPTNYILDYHRQENVYSGYMNIFCGDGSLWLHLGIASKCGLFATGINMYHNNYLSSFEYVGSPTN